MHKSSRGRVVAAVIVLAATSTASATAQQGCVSIGGIAEVRPGGEVRRSKGAASGVEIRTADGAVAAAARDMLSTVGRLSVVPRFIAQVIVGCKEQKGRFTLASLFVAKDGALVTWPISTHRAADTLNSGVYSMPADSSNPDLRNLAVPNGGSLLVDWLRGPLVIVLERLGIRLRARGTRFLVMVSPDGREAYVLLESGSLEVVGSEIALTAGKLWRISAGPPATIPRIEEGASDPAAVKQLSEAARFDEGVVSLAKSFFKNPAKLAPVGAIAALGAFVVLRLVGRDCGGACSVGVFIPIP